MSTRGRRAARPEQPHHRPVPLAPQGLVVEHRDRKGRIATYDFGTLPIAPALQRSWAVVFAAFCAPGGGWDSRHTSEDMWWLLGQFARSLAEHDCPPTEVDELTPAHWAAWLIKIPVDKGGGYGKTTRISGFLRADPRLRADTRQALAKRMQKLKPQEKAFTEEEFHEVRTKARRMFRAAHLRIQENTRILDDWRSGRLEERSEQWLLGEALDVLARTGDVPRAARVDNNGSQRVDHRYVKALGGEDAYFTWKRLYLNRMEAAALAVLLAAEFGLNATTVEEMATPRATPDSGEGGSPTYRLELEKRRRDSGRHFETRNVTDLGADTSGRLITQALEATAHARTFIRGCGSDVDRLLLWRAHHTPRSNETVLRVGPFGAGLHRKALQDWGTLTGLGASPMRRLRKTTNVLHRRAPSQNSQDTHDRVYVVTEPQAQQAAVPVIAEGAADALEAARRTVVAQLADTRRDGDQGTATADCCGYRNSPFAPRGQACDASFLLCLACPNARITPDHHPRLVLLHKALDDLRGVLHPDVWAEDWDDAHARLADLRQRLGEPTWQAATAEISPADHDLVHDLLNGHYDR
ncbi:hypothetical protein [Streptosporangium sp. NPDC049046]|uniref:hypothetical protein n=1 Tax=Streptosporangium sp. NPDC049046 TaxID=3155031 RepID=UPI00342EED9B